MYITYVDNVIVGTEDFFKHGFKNWFCGKTALAFHCRPGWAKRFFPAVQITPGGHKNGLIFFACGCGLIMSLFLPGAALSADALMNERLAGEGASMMPEMRNGRH